jgi:hypothetical protein
MRRLPFEIYGASALMAGAIALLVRILRRERSTMHRAKDRFRGGVESVMHRSA